MNRYKVHTIVEFVKSCGDFSHDMDDVISGLDGILSSYGICETLTHAEYCLLTDELLGLAEKAEIREAVRWAGWQLECGQDLSLGSDYRIPAIPGLSKLRQKSGIHPGSV